jgi:hypothetical protein
MDFLSVDLLVMLVIGIIGSIVTFLGMRKPTPPAPVQPKASDTQVAADKQTDEAIKKAEQDAATEKAKIEAAYHKAVDVSVEHIVETTEKVKSDTEATNEVLHGVGDQMRDK